MVEGEMSQRLEEAIAELRSLPESEQDWAADNIRAIVRERGRRADMRLTPQQIADVAETLADLDSGRTRLLTEEETNEMWRRLGM